jgi:epoxyqueuosine reductase QueG
VVEIGGRTFKYANKNIWRCAWAEHFNLDLNSGTLKKDAHVDEQVILDELHTRGVRGHERGVCQKVCVPPHLRTKKPSFGRDLMIAQNRINARYPESMPTLRKMRDDVIARAVELGFDLAAVAPLNPDTEAGKRAIREAPGVRTVLAFAFQTPPEASRPALPQKSNEAYGYAAGQKAHQALLRLARMIEDYGYSAASYTCDATAHEFAVTAGLGTMNAGVFVTPEFGAHQRVGAIATSAPLDASARTEGRSEAARSQRLTGPGLRRELEALANRSLVTLFGVTPAERLDPVAAQLKRIVDESQLGKRIVDTNKGLLFHGAYVPAIVDEDVRIRKPSDYVAGAQSVLVLGMHYPAEVVCNAGLEKSQQVGCYNFHQYQTCFELRFAALDLATYLSKMGYATMITENLLGVGSYTDSPRGPLPDMRCGALEAVAAGLGEIGASGALLTAEHGPRQRLICLITDAELGGDAPAAATGVCAACALCADACPMDALSGRRVALDVGGISVNYPLVPRHRCDWAKRYSLTPEEGPALIGAKTNVKAPAGDITIEMLAQACAAKDPIMKCRTCILEPCLRQCPAGPKTT